MKNKIILMLFTILSINSLAQTVNKNQQKYWDYRDRLKKWYMKVGSENGESQIMDTRGLSRNNSIDTTIYGNVFPRNTHWLNWGDNTTIQLGYYISTLSMEYKLLKKNGKDTKATLNELYYASNF